MKTFLIVILIAFTFPAIAQPVLPDAKLTPGQTMPGVTVEQLCQKGYANVLNGGARNVPESEKREVFIRYFGKVPSNPGAFEIDHVISIELGGANTISNLFPQSYSGIWNARVKDRLEDWMAAQVRHSLAEDGHATAAAKLALFQKEISSNWTNAYVKYLGQPKVNINHGKATQ